LRATEERLRLLVDSVQDYALLMLDPEGNVVSWNTGAERIKGYKAEEILGKHFSCFYLPEAVASHHPEKELAIAAKEGRYEEEGWRKRKDGSTFLANVVISAVYDQAGKVLGFAKVTRDITERKLAEESLRASEERFRLLVDSVKDYALLMLDPEGNVVSWNGGAERIKGYKAEEIIGKHFSRFYLPEAIAAGHPQRELVTATREGRYEEEGWRQRKDGSRFWANVVITSIYDNAGKVQGFVKVTRDITERKIAEERLDRLRTEHRDVLNSVGEGIHWLHVDGRIKFENPASAKMLGYEPSELIGQPAHSIMHHTRGDGTPYPVNECPIYATLRDEKVRRIKDEVFWRKDGTSFPVEYTCTPIKDEHGNFAGVVVVFADISERHRTDSEMDRMQKQLIDTSRQAGMAEVATSVLHNVGNVLNSINVSSTLVSERVKKSKVASLPLVATMLKEHAGDLAAFLTSDPKGKQIPLYLEQLGERLVKEQTTTLDELTLLHQNIEHVKDIVMMQQTYAKVSGVIETVKVSYLVEEALRLNLGTLQRHSIEVIREFDGDPTIDVEKHKVLQILVNLVGNAKHACSESGRQDKRLLIRTNRCAASIKIAVIDNGIGIPPENLTRIFNHGFTTRKDGHGFGLHSAVLAAMEMSGTLNVHSDGAGNGATFTLELPLKPTAIVR
jgi:PAS domain S-box-containing protein